MAITQAMATSFKVEILQGLHAFGTSVIRAGTGADTFKISLYTSAATLGATTTAYTATNEVATAGGYTAGGNTLSIAQAPTSTSTTAWLDFADTTWSASTITARGALIYNDTSAADRAVAVLDFGTDKSSSSGDFTIVFPTADSTNAIIRIA
jgi:hypothetical protein